MIEETWVTRLLCVVLCRVPGDMGPLPMTTLALRTLETKEAPHSSSSSCVWGEDVRECVRG